MMSSKYISRDNFPNNLPKEATFFCILCGAPSVEKVREADGTVHYQCAVCGGKAERFLAWDPGMVQHFNEAGELVHSGGGVIVQNQKSEILLLKQAKYPFLWTVPGGHMDVGEDPEKTAARELFEETKITVEKLQPVFTGEIRGDSCSGGADIHFWYTYHCQVPNGTEPQLDTDEGREWGWFSLDALPELTMPVGYLLSLSKVRASLK